MRLQSRTTILVVGMVVAMLGVVLFFLNGGTFSRPNSLQIGLLVFQIGAGILVVEGVIGYALERDNRAKAGHAISDLVAFVDSFDERAIRLVAGLGASDLATMDGEPNQDSYADRFAFAGEFRAAHVVEFSAWLADRLKKADEDCRSLTHFLKFDEVVEIRSPLRRMETLHSTLLEISRTRGARAERWAACMFALDRLRAELARSRQAMEPFVHA